MCGVSRLTNLAHRPKFAHMHNDLINSAEAAALLRVDRATFNRWVTRGNIPIEVQFPGYKGARLFRRIDVERVVNDRATTKTLAS